MFVLLDAENIKMLHRNYKKKYRENILFVKYSI